MSNVFGEIVQRYGLKTEYSRERAVGKINNYSCSIEYINNSYNIYFNVSNADQNIIDNLRRDIFSAQKDLVYLKNPIVNSKGTSFEINDKEYVDYTYFGSESYITTDIMIQILDYICRLFSAYNMLNICSVCGKTGIINTYEITRGNMSQIENMCDMCAVGQENGNNNVSTKKRVIALLASFAAGLISAIIYAFIYYFGYILYISGVLIAGACVGTYNFIMKKNNTCKIDYIIIGVITIFCCFIGQTSGFVANVYSSGLISATVFDTIKFCIYSLSDSSVFGELLKDTLILLIPAVATNIIFIVNACKNSMNVNNNISGRIRRI